jgi:hypothetical protein
MSYPLEKTYNNVYTYATATSETSSTPVNTSSSPSIMPTNGVDNNSTLTSSNTSTTNNEPKVKAAEIERTLETICKKANIDWNTIKSDGLEIFNKLGIPYNQAEYDQSTAKEITEGFRALIETLQSQGVEINAKNLLKVAQCMIDNKILQDMGISQEEYQSMKQNGEAKGIRELLGLSADEEIPEDKAEAFFKQRYEEIETKLNSIKDPIEREQVMKKEMADQRKWLAVLFVSTEPKDKAVLKKAIEIASSDDKSTFLKYLLQSVSPKEAQSISNELGKYNEYENLIGTDVYGNEMSPDKMVELGTVLKQHQDKNTITQQEIEFLEMLDSDEVKTILDKVKNDIPLSDEEQKIYDKLSAYAAATMAGSATSFAMDNNDKREVLTSLNSDYYSTPMYRDVLEQVNQYADSHQGEMNISKQEFDNLMNEVTNQNYTTVINDIKNGTTTELNPANARTTKEKLEAELKTSHADIGYRNSETSPINPTELETAKAMLYAEQTATLLVSDSDTTETEVEKQAEQKSLTDSIKNGYEGMKEYINNNGLTKFVKGVFNNISNITNKAVVNWAVNFYSNLNTNTQAQILKSANNAAIDALLPETGSDALKQLKGVTFANTLATQKVQEAVKEMEEKESNAVE